MDIANGIGLADVINDVAESVVLDVTQVAAMIGICTRGVTRLVERRAFPQPIRLGNRCVWLRTRVLEHLEKLDTEAQGDAHRAA